jgi:hypothetical protein
MKVTVTADYKKAVFTWSDDLMDCDMVSIGFDDDELDAIMEAKGHEGADVAGYVVTIQ